ncbi:hypothetical protein HanRHA438_Chr14g0648681 [Helianthus annuus]|nr:hypothetical protein HanHA89_Chr14g0566791 [Helianthus annuus]KAJ0839890.1 hypothetical protein HanPSC8_Chr14g0612121 [Helianthus annuus]KAJ0853224.1 hypothetical protein HanRHA438_Chr14g0648681 [Helianthus annuus]
MVIYIYIYIYIYISLNVLKVALQVFSVAAVAATNQGIILVFARNTLAIALVLCFVGSKWVSHFVYKCFHYHGYNHALISKFRRPLYLIRINKHNNLNKC